MTKFKFSSIVPWCFPLLVWAKGRVHKVGLFSCPYSPMSPQIQQEFSCPFCSQKIKNRSGLTQHINRVHSDTNSYRPAQDATKEDPPPCMGHDPSQCTQETHPVLNGKTFLLCVIMGSKRCSYTNTSLWS